MSTIIKATDSREHVSGKIVQHVAFDFGDMADQAHQYLEQVRKRAAGIIEQAQHKARDVIRQAEQQGRESGLKSVEALVDEQVAQHVASLAPALQEILQGIHEAKQDWMNHWHKSVVHLACSIAARVLRSEVARRPEITLALVREALELSAGSPDIVVRMNPDDYRVLGDQARTLADQFGELAPARVVADPSISRGGCRVETRFGAVDQQFEAQLARIEAELT